MCGSNFNETDIIRWRVLAKLPFICWSSPRTQYCVTSVTDGGSPLRKCGIFIFDWDSCFKRGWKPYYTPVTTKQLHDHNLDRIGEKSNVHRCHKLPFDAKLKKKKKYKRPKELPKLLGRKNCEDYHEKIKHGMLIEWKNTTKSISNIFLIYLLDEGIAKICKKTEFTMDFWGQAIG